MKYIAFPFFLRLNTIKNWWPNSLKLMEASTKASSKLRTMINLPNKLLEIWPCKWMWLGEREYYSIFIRFSIRFAELTPNRPKPIICLSSTQKLTLTMKRLWLSSFVKIGKKIEQKHFDWNLIDNFFSLAISSLRFYRDQIRCGAISGVHWVSWAITHVRMITWQSSTMKNGNICCFVIENFIFFSVCWSN